MTILKNIKWLLIVAILPMFAACGWADLPTYDEAEILGVQFKYRWLNTDPDWNDAITGEPEVLEQSLNVTPQIDSSTGTINVVVSLPSTNADFTESVRNGVTVNDLVGQVTLSTAARIAPSDNHKVLGVPDDWSQPHNFVVTAADGTKKNWTITVTSLTK